ncbi:type II secretion system protein GspM [Arhodomonas sp. AD133]|uniref:type II secretion system protein GspM n=1 Tax=Arhodomonas sp. AD133 TaxID=3415009 RepID=UPI003EBD36FC
MKQWWAELQPRERRTLSLGGAALVIVLFYFLVWLPPRAALPELREQVAQQRTDLQWMRAAAAQARQLRQRRGDTDTSASQPRRALYALADESAREAGLGDAIDQVEPSGDDQVRVALRDAPFDRITIWLAGVRKRYGITVESASIQASDDSGRVDARLVLRGAGS